MSDEKEDKLDIFKMAAEKALHNVPDTDEVSEEVEALVTKGAEIIVKESKEWEKLALRFDGDYTERFMAVLDNLPDREYVRTYVKLLEYFKPKIIRKDTTPADKVDNVINIQILQVDEDGKKVIIDISDDKEEKE